MITYKTRIDRGTLNKVNATHMSLSEIARRVARKIKKGISYTNTCNLNKVALDCPVTIFMPGDLSGIPINDIRDNIIAYYQNEAEQPKFKIDKEDLNAKYIVELCE